MRQEWPGDCRESCNMCGWSEIEMWQMYLQPGSVEEALALLRQHAGYARLVAGGNDVLVELSRGVRPTKILIDITALRALKYIREENGRLLLGALTTHNDIIASRACVQLVLPLAQACAKIGSPQIRARATVVGNLVTAAPTNDTITALTALGAELVLARQDGERVVALDDFYAGPQRSIIQLDELVREIRIPTLQANQRALFLSLGLRRAQAISVINIALVLTFAGEEVTRASIALGALAPTIVHARNAEMYLLGKRLDDAICREAGNLALQDVVPIDDVRGSGTYRQATVTALVRHGLQRLASGRQAEGWMPRPVLLQARIDTVRSVTASARFTGTIDTVINGKPYLIADAQRKTLLNMLREDAGLTGAKEGCAQGRCGACTVWLNGRAVVSCMVPAAQAHNGRITTIEGLAAEQDALSSLQGAELHPLQQTFIDCAAVQCGFCTPGMLMAAAKLLQEYPHPTLEQIRIALSGNICRCTGYRKIIEAVARAAERG